MKVQRTLFVLIGMSMLPYAANATMINGIFNTAGSATVSNSSVHFFDATGANQFVILPPESGSFVGSTGGTIDDLVGPPFTASITDFLNVTGPGAFTTVLFDLTSIAAGSAGTTNCSGPGATQAGKSCTPVVGSFVSPFTLTNNTDGSVEIGFTLFMNGYTGTSASGVTPYTASFSTSLANMTIASVLAELASNGSISASYQGNFSPSPAPEPGTMALMGLSLITCAFFIKRRVVRGK